MIRVGTAALKAHLSAHLRAVRAGETVLVLDRNEVIARIVPVSDEAADLVVRPARGSLRDLPLPAPVDPPADDILDDLRRERAERL